MQNFDKYLSESGEVGYVEEITNSIVYASGLPNVKPQELVIFEGGGQGSVVGLGKESIEILLISADNINVGTRLTRTDQILKMKVGEGLLGKVLNSLGEEIKGYEHVNSTVGASQQKATGLADPGERELDVPPPGVFSRKAIDQPFETGVTIVDLAVPLARGQRELVVGDLNSGKTVFLIQSLKRQVQQGAVCIYAAIGKKRVSIKRLSDLFVKEGLSKSTLLVASNSMESAGMVYLTPFCAMTIAEYFRDQGRDVFLILDDMTTHAKYYREIALLSKRFPGRNSYPGDIFFVQGRILERAGRFEKGSITAFPVAESVLGDLSGYIQTNLMAVTDGHIFFDTDLVELGKFPAVNPLLSVTRVGLQAGTPLLRDVSRTMTRFLANVDKNRAYLHFGAELSETVKKNLDLGKKLDALFQQGPDRSVALPVSILYFGILWAGFWRKSSVSEVKASSKVLLQKYLKDTNYSVAVDSLISESKNVSEFLNNLRLKDEIVSGSTPKTASAAVAKPTGGGIKKINLPIKEGKRG